MKVLVTGGAGYIGSVAMKMLKEKGHEPISLDIKPSDRQGDLCDKSWLKTVFAEGFDAVMHFAAYKNVGESMKNPAKYGKNITGLINVLDCMKAFGVTRIIFSSSCATYGNAAPPITEESVQEPVNFYGYTKLAGERLLEWYDVSFVSLRYFNVAGDACGFIDPAPMNILPLLLESVLGKREITVFGDDFDTPDGSGVRDYIAVSDLIEAHILALESDVTGSFNLGTGKGTSVFELITLVEEVSGKKVPFSIGPRREGDPACLYADATKAKEKLGWVAKTSMKEMIEQMWKTYSTFHPNGKN